MKIETGDAVITLSQDEVKFLKCIILSAQEYRFEKGSWPDKYVFRDGGKWDENCVMFAYDMSGLLT